MANNQSIQFLRKISGAVNDNDIKSLLPGQPLVDFTNKKLLIGTEDSKNNPGNVMQFYSGVSPTKLYYHYINMQVTLKTTTSYTSVAYLSIYFYSLTDSHKYTLDELPELFDKYGLFMATVVPDDDHRQYAETINTNACEIGAARSSDMPSYVWITGEKYNQGGQIDMKVYINNPQVSTLSEGDLFITSVNSIVSEIN